MLLQSPAGQSCRTGQVRGLPQDPAVPTRTPAGWPGLEHTDWPNNSGQMHLIGWEVQGGASRWLKRLGLSHLMGCVIPAVVLVEITGSAGSGHILPMPSSQEGRETRVLRFQLLSCRCWSREKVHHQLGAVGWKSQVSPTPSSPFHRCSSANLAPGCLGAMGSAPRSPPQCRTARALTAERACISAVCGMSKWAAKRRQPHGDITGTPHPAFWSGVSSSLQTDGPHR